MSCSIGYGNHGGKKKDFFFVFDYVELDDLLYSICIM